MAAINGVDDLLAAVGPDRVLDLFDAAKQPTDKRSQAQQLVELAADAELFRTPDSEAYARVPVDGHMENWQIKGRGFKRWLTANFYRKYKKPPGAQALQDALGVLEAQAQFESPQVPAPTRVAGDGDSIFIDLGNDRWEAVQVTPDGWRVVADPTVRFRRAPGALALPDPETGGSIGLLRKYLNLDQHEAWVLVVCWLVAVIRPKGPYPVLVLQGPQGSAKSTTARALRRLVDPNSAPLRTAPRDERDLHIAAANSWIIGLDNVSGIPNWLSDALCRVATGGGLTTRTLYTDTDETILNVTRPILLNGIDQLCERPDLADRALIINLPPIGEKDRRDEETYWQEFERDLPFIFGALLDAVVMALRRLPGVKLPRLPRMADFAKWATAAEPGVGLAPGAFMEAYSHNRADGVDAVFESDAFAAALRAFMESSDSWVWTGIADDLRKQVDSRVDDGVKKSPSWPKTPRAVSGRLRRLQTTLREIGIVVEFTGKKTAGRREISITRASGYSTATTAPTATTQAQPEEGNGCAEGQQSGGQADRVAHRTNMNGQPPLR